MRAKDIKIGSKYMVELDAKGKLEEVTIIDVYKQRVTHTSGAGGMCSVWYTVRTVAEVRDSNWERTTGVPMRNIKCVAETTCAMGCEDCGGMCAEDSAGKPEAKCTGCKKFNYKCDWCWRAKADAADSAGFAAPNTISEQEFAACLEAGRKDFC